MSHKDWSDLYQAEGSAAIAAEFEHVNEPDFALEMQVDGVLELKPLEKIMQAINSDDPGALFEPDMLNMLRQIRNDNPADWQRIRIAAKGKKIQVGELERITKGKDDDDEKVLFATIEPWADRVNGAALIRELSDLLKRYVTCTPEVADAAALWIVFTWFVNEVEVAPIANITAPLPNCGKSTLLRFIGTFAFQSLKCDGISAAGLFRSMDRWHPTLLIDEVDAFLRDNEDARGVINSGHEKDGFVIRVEGEGSDREPVKFGTYGAKALCGIGSIADTLASRSIRLELRRKLPHEKVENVRRIPSEVKDRLNRQLARLHDDLAEAVRDARPSPINGLNNRTADNWEPLQQIAEAVGGEWPERVIKVATMITFSDDHDQAPDINTELLKDIKAIFEKRKVDRIFSQELVTELHSDSEAPWNSYNRGKPITARQVARKLGEFGVYSGSIRIGAGNAKGYYQKDFKDAFERYLLPDPPFSSVTTLQPSNHAGYSDISKRHANKSVTDENGLQPAPQAGCDVVTDKTPPFEKEGKNGRVF